jgi:hypothetical protein
MKVDINADGLAKVEVEDFDLYNLDFTLSKIILPALIKFRANLTGYPTVDNADVPEHLYISPTESWSEEQDKVMRKQYEYVLDEIIFAFVHNMDDEAGYDPEEETRARKGMILFGKYFRSLWN